MWQRICAVHPHERGAVYGSPWFFDSDLGSSPRAWGSFDGNTLLVWSERFIPTSVGQLISAETESGFSSVHPHERGAVIGSFFGCLYCVGSSPRAWGSSDPLRFCTARERFIPTSVGQLSIAQASQSSPRFIPTSVGQLRAFGRRVACVRFIPTSVGQFLTREWCRCSKSVHPHERGAVKTNTTITSSLSGSSPRAWGSFHSRLLHHESVRFIPTSVGQFLKPMCSADPTAVHPHERGAVNVTLVSEKLQYGSSPRAWGS